MALMAAPNAAPAKNTPRISAPAAIFHLTQADIAIAMRDSTVIHTSGPMNSAPAIHRLARVHSQPARLDWTPNRIRPGIQVMVESMNISTLILPRIYSVLENGRERYNG